MIIKVLIPGYPWHELTDDCVEIIEVDNGRILPILTRYLSMLQQTDKKEQYGKALVKEIQCIFDRAES